MNHLFKILCGMFLMVNISAEEEIIGDFFQSGTIYQLESGKKELDSALQFSKNAEYTRFEMPIWFGYGFTDHLQAGISWTSFVHHNPEYDESTSGIGDSGLDVQYAWSDIGKMPFHAAVGLNVNIATGDEEKELGEGETIVQSHFILATNSIKNVHISWESGIEKTHEESNTFTNIAMFTTTNPVSIALEYNWTKDEKYITTGIIWQSTESLNLGLGIPVGLNDDSDDFSVILTSKYGFD